MLTDVSFKDLSRYKALKQYPLNRSGCFGLSLYLVSVVVHVKGVKAIRVFVLFDKEADRTILHLPVNICSCAYINIFSFYNLSFSRHLSSV